MPTAVIFGSCLLAQASAQFCHCLSRHIRMGCAMQTHPLLPGRTSFICPPGVGSTIAASLTMSGGPALIALLIVSALESDGEDALVCCAASRLALMDTRIPSTNSRFT